MTVRASGAANREPAGRSNRRPSRGGLPTPCTCGSPHSQTERLPEPSPHAGPVIAVDMRGSPDDGLLSPTEILHRVLAGDQRRHR